MTKNMFYNYDVYDKNEDVYECSNKTCKNIREVDYAYDISGNIIGLKAKADSNFTIYFSFYSEDNLEMSNLLKSCPIMLEILDTNREIMTTIQADFDESHRECSVYIDLALYKNLTRGKYKLYLYYIENGIKKQLYDKANLLSIK